jgi:hypothetical protein
MDDKTKPPKGGVTLPPPLPATVEGWVLTLKREPSINDQVQSVHKSLIPNPEYRALLRATTNPQALEGSIASDNNMAALMIREKAKVMPEMDLINGDANNERANLQTIIIALNVVLNRYGLGRKQRKNLVGGEQAPSDNGDDNGDTD